LIFKAKINTTHVALNNSSKAEQRYIATPEVEQMQKVLVLQDLFIAL